MWDSLNPFGKKDGHEMDSRGTEKISCAPHQCLGSQSRLFHRNKILIFVEHHKNPLTSYRLFIYIKRPECI